MKISNCSRRFKLNYFSDYRGQIALAAIALILILGILALKIQPLAEKEILSNREFLLSQRLSEYNRALVRYLDIKGNLPSNIEQLIDFPGGLRTRYTDPFTGKSDFQLSQKNFCFVSGSNYNSIRGQNISELTGAMFGTAGLITVEDYKQQLQNWLNRAMIYQ